MGTTWSVRRVHLFALVSCLALPAVAGEPNDLAGTWDVKLTVNYATCKGVAVGDVSSMQLVVRVENGKLKAETLGNKSLTDLYAGTIEGDQLVLKARRFGHEATIEATLDGSMLKGRRVEANGGPCAVIHDLSAKKL